jgi:replicative DNA helicase
MNHTEEILLPALPDIERMVLGALLTDPNQIDMAIGNLTADDFSTEPNRRIFLRAKDLRDRGDSVDRVTIAMKLREEGQLASIGGMSYIVSLDEGLPEIHNLENYIALLRQKALARKVIICASDAIRRAALGDEPLALIESLRTIGERLEAGKRDNFQTPGEIIAETGLDEFFCPSHSLGIEPPIPWLAERMRFEPGTQTILAALTGGGKTALAAQCAWEAISRGYRVAWYTLEMRARENLRRLVGQVGRVNMHRLKMGLGDSEERAQALYALNRILEHDELLMFRDTPIDVQAVNSDQQRLAMKGKKPHLNIIDHLLLMDGAGESRAQEVSKLSRGLKLTWMRHNNAGLVLSQFRRHGGNPTDEPNLDWLRESGSIEQDADHVIFLHPIRADDFDAEIRAWRLKLAKQRTGPVGRCDLQFIRRYVVFEHV